MYENHVRFQRDMGQSYDWFIELADELHNDETDFSANVQPWFDATPAWDRFYSQVRATNYVCDYLKSKS